MTLMKPFLIILTALMVLVGLTFLILYLVKRKKTKKDNEKQVLNQRLNLYLAILILVGALFVGSFIFMIY